MTIFKAMCFRWSVVPVLALLTVQARADEATLDTNEAAISAARNTDPIRRLSPRNEENGTLVCTGEKSIIIRHLPEATSSIGITSKTLYIPLKTTGKPADPILISADSILFKVRDAASYDLYRLDFRAPHLQKLTTAPLSDERVSVSPDGKWALLLRADAARTTLTALEIATGKEKPLVENETVGKGGWVWTPQNSILYGAIPKGEKYPNLYETGLQGGEPRLILHEAWRPTLSPNGKLIACFGVEDEANPGPLSAKWESNPRGASVTIAERDGSNRHAIWRQTGAYPLLLWEADGNGLVTIKDRKWVPDLGTHRISEFKPLREDEYKGGLVGQLGLGGGWSYTALLGEDLPDYSVYQIYPSPNVDYQFRSLIPGADGNIYFVERIAKKSEGGTKTTDILWAKRGRQFHQLAMVEGEGGLDWHDEALPGAWKTDIKALLATQK